MQIKALNKDTAIPAERVTGEGRELRTRKVMYLRLGHPRNLNQKA